jgi:hypothetical protein
MSNERRRKRTLREIEQEVEAEGREWMRQRLEEKLQREAERDGTVFPPQPEKGAASARPGAPAKDRRRSG